MSQERYVAIREWGDKWTLFDTVEQRVLINQSTNRAQVLDEADRLNLEEREKAAKGR